MEKRTIISVCIAVFISLGLVFVPKMLLEDSSLSMDPNKMQKAELVYRVYLEGQSVGITKSNVI